MMPIRNALRTYWLAMLFVAANFVLVASIYGLLPDPLPLLWSADGEPIAWLNRPAGSLLLPLVHLFLLLFLVVAPAVDPGALRAPEAPRFYLLIVAAISCFLLLATGLVFAAALGVALRLPNALLGGFGALLALIGNYMGKIPKNYVVGIRTPWTLSSDYVWERTHRFAAPLFVTSGIALLLHGVLQRDELSSLFVGAIILVAILAPYCFSYLTWKRTVAGNLA